MTAPQTPALELRNLSKISGTRFSISVNFSVAMMPGAITLILIPCDA